MPDFMDHPPYHERYCAFVDILGFSSLVDRLGRDQSTFDMMKGLLTQVHNPDKGSTKSWYTEFRAQSISDAVAISTLKTSVGLIQLCNATERLSLELLAQGFFVRGAIVKGMLYHDEKMVFGEALVKAYHFESQIVRYPRIMLTRDVISDLEGYFERNELGSEVRKRFRQADDGPWHVHILRNLELLGENPGLISNPKHRDGAFYAQCQSQIQRRLQEATDNPAHFEKVKWFAAYWNTINLPLSGGINQIVGPGLPMIRF